MMPNGLPPWQVVYQQAQRWIKARCFEAMAHDLRVILREGRRAHRGASSARCFDQTCAGIIPLLRAKSNRPPASITGLASPSGFRLYTLPVE